MKRTILNATIFCFLLQSCAVYQAQNELNSFQKETQKEISDRPALLLKFQKEIALECSTSLSCSPKLILFFEDNKLAWKAVNVPSYQTFFDRMEYFLRRNTHIIPTDEVMLAIWHILAAKVDSGEITQEQFMVAGNQAITEGINRLLKEYARLQQNVTDAKKGDEETWKLVGEIAVAVVVVALVAVVITASVNRNGGVGYITKYPCDYPWQIASDGSICGNRAASVRPGGREP